jgi:hypothetical protein
MKPKEIVRKILRKLYGSSNKKGAWRILYNRESYQLHEESDIKVVKAGRLRWLGNVYRTQEKISCEKVAFAEMEGTRRVGSPPHGVA